MQLSYSALLLVALSLDGAFASPARHRHSHQRRGVDYNDPSLYTNIANEVDFTKIKYPGSPEPAAAAPAAPPAAAPPAASASASAPAPSVPENKAAAAPPSSSPVPAPTQASSSKPASGGASTSGFGGRTAPKEDGVDADRIGNVGAPYGSNMKEISESDLSNWKYTNVISNTGSSQITVNVWNKACPDGKVAGWTCPVLKLEIPAGGKKTVAFDEDTQGGLATDCGTDPTRGGVPNCPWGEFDFGNIKNNGWSGYDRSSIPATGNSVGQKLTMSSQSGVVSSKEANSFTDVSQTNAGGALTAGPAHMTTEF